MTELERTLGLWLMDMMVGHITGGDRAQGFLFQFTEETWVILMICFRIA